MRAGWGTNRYMSHPDLPAWRAHALLTAAEAAELDRITIALGTPGFTLMQRAGAVMAEIIREAYRPGRCLALCGPGNNGGDGFIAAEFLRRAGWDVRVAMLTPPEALHGDAALARLFYQGEILPWSPQLPEDAELMIDALFGIGLDRPLGREFAAAIDAVNESKIPVVAVDIPSGIHADSGAVMGAAIKVKTTVTFTRKKPGLLALPGREMAGEVIVREIGMDADAMRNMPAHFAENHPALWRDALPEFRAEQHKYDHGYALILGGGVMTGAARLAARAIQRVGTGLVTIAAPPEAVPVYATSLDSVLVLKLSDAAVWREAVADKRKTAVLAGPGSGIGPQTRAAVLAALESGKPCVLDADALTSFADAPEELFAALHPRCILTPHMGEFARLFKQYPAEASNRLAAAVTAAQGAGAVVLLKGADTIIASPDGYAAINTSAPPWLATAGSGDVLAGVITGFLAQGMEPFLAACAGAWLHGLAARNFHPGMIAEDLIGALPAALAGVKDGSP